MLAVRWKNYWRKSTRSSTTSTYTKTGNPLFGETNSKSSRKRPSRSPRCLSSTTICNHNLTQRLLHSNNPTNRQFWKVWVSSSLSYTKVISLKCLLTAILNFRTPLSSSCRSSPKCTIKQAQDNTSLSSSTTIPVSTQWASSISTTRLKLNSTRTDLTIQTDNKSQTTTGTKFEWVLKILH